MTYKFGSLVGAGETPYVYPDIWCREKTTGPDRLVLAPSSNQIDLLLELCSAMGEPFGVLYVLLTPRQGHEPGRYQSAEPLSAEQLARFVHSFEDFFEGDGRHHLWIMSLPGNSQVIYDNHDVIYAYGNLDAFEMIARRRSMTEQRMHFPVPHTHCYNQEFDADENRIIEEYQWIHFPLQRSDDP